MAIYKEYKCEGCGYTLAANPKGKDMVMMGETETFLCPDCKEIVDVVYPYGEKPEKVVCPDCGGDQIQKWNPIKGKCPKCGGNMKATGVQMCLD